jgi:hypothetical protein
MVQLVDQSSGREHPAWNLNQAKFAARGISLAGQRILDETTNNGGQRDKFAVCTLILVPPPNVLDEVWPSQQNGRGNQRPS